MKKFLLLCVLAGFQASGLVAMEQAETTGRDSAALLTNRASTADAALLAVTQEHRINELREEVARLNKEQHEKNRCFCVFGFVGGAIITGFGGLAVIAYVMRNFLKY